MKLSDVYYFTKPAIPLGVRLALRRVLANHLRRRHGSTWPINQVAGKAPENWPGWPNGKRFAFVVTHDVEGRKGLEQARALAELDKEMGFRASFNFVPEGEYRVAESMRWFLTENGFEVGVHDLHHDGTLYRSWKRFRNGAKKINEYVEEWRAEGFRSGFMRHDLRWLHEVNVLYDSSTFDTDPFEPQPDGVETIFPFWVSQDAQYGYVELPYTLPQDSTLFLLLRENSIDIWKRKLDWIAERGGLALVNVHADYLNFGNQNSLREYSQQLYRDLLKYVADRYSDRCWFALPREVARYCYANMVPRAGLNRRLVAQEAVIQNRQTGQLEALVADRTVVTPEPGHSGLAGLQGKRMAVVSFSSFPGDPRPRRAAETFLRAGTNVEVLCLVEDGSPRRETLHGIDIERLPIKHNRGSKFVYVARYCVFILIIFLKLGIRSLRRRYDVVHVHNMPDVLVFAALVPKCLGAKVILDLHDPMPELMMTIFNSGRESLAVRIMAQLEKWSIAFADSVLTVNRACEKLFISRGCPPSKIRIVMNSPDERIFRYVPARIGDGIREDKDAPFVIMYHGTLVERNGVDLAVDALVEIRKTVPEAELRIYGPRTPFLDKVMVSVSEKGLEKAVQYLGPRKLEQLAEAIAECNVGVIPNRKSIFTEINTPTRIFEYLALGKPVVAPRAPGIQDYFNEDALVMFDLGNADDLANRLSWVARNPKEVLEITKRGQAVYRLHTWQEEKAKLETVVTKLLNPESRS